MKNYDGVKFRLKHRADPQEGRGEARISGFIVQIKIKGGAELHCLPLSQM